MRTGYDFRMRVLVERALAASLLGFIILFAGDWLVYRYRAAHGKAFDSVSVSQFTALPLKNGKYEFDYAGSQQVGCVHALFPWAGDDPCWWVRRHAQSWTKV